MRRRSRYEEENSEDELLDRSRYQFGPFGDEPETNERYVISRLNDPWNDTHPIQPDEIGVYGLPPAQGDGLLDHGLAEQHFVQDEEFSREVIRNAALHTETRELFRDGEFGTRHTGLKRDEEVEKQKREAAAKRAANVRLGTMMDRYALLTSLGRALLSFGAPSHRIEKMLSTVADTLHINGTFIYLPGIILFSVRGESKRQWTFSPIKAPEGIDLGRLPRLHKVYRQLVHQEISVPQGNMRIRRLMNLPPAYPIWMRYIIAFGVGFSICPLAFGGSLSDMLAGGVASAFCAAVPLQFAKKRLALGMIVAALIAFVARALSALPDQMFCYRSIVQTGVVLMLPGTSILLASMDISSGGVLTGAVRFIDAIIYTFALSFAIEWGSSLFIFIQTKWGGVSKAIAASSTSVVIEDVNCTLWSGNQWSGTFDLANDTIANGPPTLATLSGCSLRTMDSPWYSRPLPSWAPVLFALAFSTFISMHHLQSWKAKQFPVMVAISVLAFVVNRLAQQWLFNSSEGVSLIGGFLIGACGHLWSRVFRGTAFTVMLAGVQLLFPTGLAAYGGLVVGTEADLQADIGNSVSPVFMVGYRMLAVTLGMATGFHLSALLVYAFGGRKKSVLLSF